MSFSQDICLVTQNAFEKSASFIPGSMKCANAISSAPLCIKGFICVGASRITTALLGHPFHCALPIASNIEKNQSLFEKSIAIEIYFKIKRYWFLGQKILILKSIFLPINIDF
jgi:hypothetical protein